MPKMKRKPLRAGVKIVPILQIGGISAECIADIRNAIISIMNTTAGDAVKISAIEHITKLGAVNGTTVENCNFTAT